MDDPSDSDGVEDRSEIYQVAGDQLKASLDVQSKWLENIHNRALDVVRFNQIIIAAIITAFGIIPVLRLNIFLAATIASFALSLWFCILVYSPEERQSGLSPTNKWMDSNVDDIEMFRRKTVAGYNNALNDNDIVINRKNRRFRLGLWSSFAGVLFFIVAVFRSVFGSPPQFIDTLPIPVLVDFAFLIGVFVVTVIGWYLTTG